MKDNDLFKNLFSGDDDTPETPSQKGFPEIVWGISDERTNEIDADVQTMVHDGMCPEHATPESSRNTSELLEDIQKKYGGDEQKWAIFVLGCEVTKLKIANNGGAPFAGMLEHLKGLLGKLGIDPDANED